MASPLGQSVTNSLYDRYYNGSEDDKNFGLISSHWRHYSQQFRVEINSKSEVVSLSGTAFGSVLWSNVAHRLLDQACILTHLVHIPNRLQLVKYYSRASQICRLMGLDPTFDVFRQIASLCQVVNSLPQEMSQRRINFLMIGDGYGVLSAFTKTLFPNSTVTMVDIGKTLLFQAYYCQKAFPKLTHHLSISNLDMESADFVYCPAEHLNSLEKFQFDVAINIASFQEMNSDTIHYYFKFLRRCLTQENRFYCCNRESKTLMGGEVNKFQEYPWQPNDCHLVDEYCKWHRYYLAWDRFKIPAIPLNINLPVIKFYDGPLRHRLTLLHTERA